MKILETATLTKIHMMSHATKHLTESVHLCLLVLRTHCEIDNSIHVTHHNLLSHSGLVEKYPTIWRNLTSLIYRIYIRYFKTLRHKYDIIHEVQRNLFHFPSVNFLDCIIFLSQSYTKQSICALDAHWWAEGGMRVFVDQELSRDGRYNQRLSLEGHKTGDETSI